MFKNRKLTVSIFSISFLFPCVLVNYTKHKIVFLTLKICILCNILFKIIITICVSANYCFALIRFHVPALFNLSRPNRCCLLASTD